MRGKWDDQVGGLCKHFIGRPIGLNPAYNYWTQQKNKSSGNGSGGPGAPPEDLSAQILELERRLEQMKKARQDPAKHSFSYQDSDAIPMQTTLKHGEMDSQQDQKRPEQHSGNAGAKPASSTEKLKNVPELLEEHAAVVTQDVLEDSRKKRSPE